MPARLTTDQLPVKLRKREIEVLALMLFTAAGNGARQKWRTAGVTVQRKYRRLASTAFRHILGTYKP